MKKALTLGVVTLVATLLGVGNDPLHAQSIQNISNDDPAIINGDCSVSYSGGNYYNTTSSSDVTISAGGTRSYQLTTTPSVEFTSTPITLTASPINAKTYQADTRLVLTNIDLSDNTFTATPTTTIIKPTYNLSDAPTLSFSNTSEPSNLLTVNDSGNISCGVAVDAVVTETQTPNVTIAVEEQTIVNPDPLSANLSVNDEYLVYVNYGDNATVKWGSTGTSSCSLDAISQSGTEGEHVLQAITSNIVITIECEAAPGYANYQIFPNWLGRVEVKVLPPTFDYLKAYLSQMQPSGNKKVSLKSVSNFVDQAQRASKTSLAQSFLQKSVDSLKQQAAKGSIPAEQVTKYENASSYLSKTLPVKVVITMDSCSVTATGPAGFILQYGANENMRRGGGDGATIPESGTITASIYAPNGWEATAEVVDSDGLIYARDTTDVTTDNCPLPPVVYDPSVYNGYPEKWGSPEPSMVIDDWGYYNKTAESYVAFRITDSGRTFPTGYGSASDWLAKATDDSYIVEYPQAGDVAINTLNAEFGGPVAWHVDSVDELGNYQTSAIRSDGNMNWSRGTIEESSYLIYIRIP